MKKKSLIIIIGALAAVLIIGIVLLVVLNGGKKGGNKSEITITYNTNGGVKIESVKVKAGEKVKLPGAQKEGYTFLGWYLNNKLIENETSFTDDVTLVAGWKKISEDAKTVKIKFDSSGGNTVSEMTVECNEVLPQLPIPTYNGYAFIGWTTSGKGITQGTKISCDNGDLTFIANWEKIIKKFTVTFNSDGGSKVDPIEVICDEELTMPANPTKDGYTFVRWEDKNANPIYDKAKLDCADIELKAIWEKVKVWKCPSSDYKMSEVNGKKVCTTTGTVKSETCPTDTQADGTRCVKLSDHVAATLSCAKKQITIPGGGQENATGTLVGSQCGYHKLDSTEATCTQDGGTWTNAGNETTNGCYVDISSAVAMCSGDYQYYTAADLQSKFNITNSAACYKVFSKVKTCYEGYELVNGACTKTVDAVEE